MNCCSKQVIETKFGPIEDANNIMYASQLHLWFIDSINDAVYTGEERFTEYMLARNLFAAPIQFHREKDREAKTLELKEAKKKRLRMKDCFDIPESSESEDDMTGEVAEKQPSKEHKKLYRAMKEEEKSILMREMGDEEKK